MLEFHCNMVQTLGIAAVVLYVGNIIKSKSTILQNYYIPAPVVGGVLMSILILIGRQFSLFSFTFDNTLQSLFMTAFFTTVGFMASLKLLAQGGLGVLVMLLVSSLLLFSQNVVGCSLSSLFGLDPKMGLLLGSVSLTGGHGTVGAFGSTIENLGVEGAQTVGFAAATYGLIVGCLIGGPIGKLLMKQYKIIAAHESEKQALTSEPVVDVVGDVKNNAFKGPNLINAAICIAISMGIGSLLAPFVKEHTQEIVSGGVDLPGYIGAMLVAAVMRNIFDLMHSKLPMGSIDALGSMSLAIFLSMAMMTMKLWELIDLAAPIVTILLVQTVLVMLFVYFITFNVMRIPFICSKYDSTVICTGHCGFSMGATPTAVANMTSFCNINGFSVKAFFIIPLIGSLFIDFINATIITAFINFFS